MKTDQTQDQIRFVIKTLTPVFLFVVAMIVITAIMVADALSLQ